MWPSGGLSRPGAVSVSAADTIAEVVMSERPDVSCGAAETLAAPSSAGPVATIAAGSRTASVVADTSIKGVYGIFTDNTHTASTATKYPATTASTEVNHGALIAASSNM